jgi:hypothetical protein
MSTIIGTSIFPPTSRYYGITTGTFILASGDAVTYLLRRFIPPPDRFDAIETHVVSQGERLDSVTALFLNDPLQFWRICDGNRAMRPDELTEVISRRLRITLPEGIPGKPNE